MRHFPVVAGYKFPYQIHDLQIFSPILWVVISLSWCYPLKYKTSSFYWNPIYFVFCCFCFCVISKKPRLNSTSQRFTPMFCPKSFTFLTLKYRSMIHFELILEHGVRQGSNFVLVHVAIQLFQHRVSKELFFWHSRWNSTDYKCMVYFWTCNSHCKTSVNNFSSSWKALFHWHHLLTPIHSSHLSSQVTSSKKFSLNLKN